MSFLVSRQDRSGAASHDAFLSIGSGLSAIKFSFVPFVGRCNHSSLSRHPCSVFDMFANRQAVCEAVCGRIEWSIFLASASVMFSSWQIRPTW